jgi:NagD protein
MECDGLYDDRLMTELAQAEAFLFDVDGTLVLSDDPNTGGGGATALDGAGEVLNLLRSLGTRFACVTNGTGQVPGSVAARLRAAGVDVADAQVLTPAVVAAEHIRHLYTGNPVLAFGTEGVIEPLVEAGIQLVGPDEAEKAGVVLIGADPEFTYDKLEAACRAVWAGAPLLVTSMAAFFASRRGKMPSTSGAIAAGIRHVTGVEPTVVGKPSPLVINIAARRLDVSPTDMVVVGDDLRLEIRMAREAGAFGVLVLSGSSGEADLATVPAELQPNLVLPVVGRLLQHLR